MSLQRDNAIRRSLALVALAAALECSCGGSAPEARFDNLVLVTIDTLRADHLGSYGYPRPTSPFLDSLAERSLVFERAVSASSHTAPSHASMLTSLYPEQHGVLVNGFALSGEVASLAPLARGAGRETAGFVSVRFLEGLDEGFEVWDSEVPKSHLFRTADLTVDRAEAWLARREPQRPFTMWVHFYDVHEHKAESRIPGKLLEAMQRDSERNGEHLLAFLRQQRGYAASRLTRNFDRYDAQIAFVDSQIRRLYASVEAHARGRPTLWAITSDHGEGMGDHDYGGHGRYLYQEQVHVPLLFHSRTGGIEIGSVAAMVRHVDLLPTLAELLGFPLREAARVEGRSLTAWLEGRPAQGSALAVAQRRPPDERRLRRGWHPGQVNAAMDGRYKYIRNSHGPDEFYDLALDPHESVNLAGGGSEPERRLREWLLRKLAELARDHRVEGDQAIPEKMLEDLRSLGYL